MLHYDGVDRVLLKMIFRNVSLFLEAAQKVISFYKMSRVTLAFEPSLEMHF